MKKIWKRNTVLITALAMMFAVAGYLHFSKDDKDNRAAGSESVDGMLTYDITSGDDANVSDVMTQDMALNETGDIVSLDEGEDVMITGDYLTENGELLPQGGFTTDSAMGITEQEGAGGALPGEEYLLDTVPGTTVMANSGIVNSFSGAKLLKEQTRAKNKELLLEIINNGNIEESQKESAIAEMIRLTDIAEKETAAEILLDAKGFGDSVVSVSENSVDVFVFAVELTDAQRAQIEDIVKRKTGIAADKIVITAVSE